MTHKDHSVQHSLQDYLKPNHMIKSIVQTLLEILDSAGLYAMTASLGSLLQWPSTLSVNTSDDLRSI